MKNRKAIIAVMVAAIVLAAAAAAWLYYDTAIKKQPAEDGKTTTQAANDITKTETPKEVEHVVIADSFVIPQVSEVNVFSYIQTAQAMNLKTQVEKLFGIDALVSTDNTVDQFFDSRGTDKSGNSVTFQQNINSGSFIFSPDFSLESNQAFAKENKNTSLESVRAQLESRARELAKEFENVTGELVFESSEMIDMTAQLSSDVENYYTYQTYNFVFKLKTPVTVPATDKVECNDNYSDRFSVILRPDGEVISIYSSLTNAPMEQTGTEKMFTLEQFKAYETANIESMYEGEGSEYADPNLQYVYTACRLVYTNDHSAGHYVPGVVITYHLADKPEDELEEYCPVKFVRDGI